MTKMKDVVKGVAKQSAPPSKGNVDPSDPWSATGAGGGIPIPENVTSRRADLLSKFYKAKGYNINYVSKNQRVGQAKTGEFEKWKQDHGIYEDESVTEDLTTRYNGKHTGAPEIRSTVSKSPTLKRKHELDAAASYYAIPAPAGSMKKVRPQTEEFELDEKADSNHPWRKISPAQLAKINKSREQDKKDAEKGRLRKSLGGEKTVKSDIAWHTYQAKMREDNINDPQCATQSPFDGANTTNDVAPKKSKAAKMVKEIYAKHRLKEDMYDHEKDDKGPGTNVKPPKVIKKQEVNDDNEKGTNARMVLKGGTTLTGEKRDTIEIDPMMKNRGKQPDYIATNTGKKSIQ